MTLRAQPANVLTADNCVHSSLVTRHSPLATRNSCLQVSTLPLPGDIRIRCHFQPTATLGAVDVAVGLGQGTRGKGQRVGDDAALHVAIVRRLACHLQQYARDFETAACCEEPAGWWERLAAASAALDPTPCVPDTAGHGWAIEMGALQAECEPF